MSHPLDARPDIPRKEDRQDIRVDGPNAYTLIERILVKNKVGIRDRSLKRLKFVIESRNFTDELKKEVESAGGTVTEIKEVDMDSGD